MLSIVSTLRLTVSSLDCEPVPGVASLSLIALTDELLSERKSFETLNELN